MTKKEAYELVVDILSGGDDSATSKYHEEVVYKQLEIARNFMIKRAYIENRNEGSYDISGEFVKGFQCVPVLLDDCRDEYYSDLPAKLISLPNNRGLRSVSPMKGQNAAFSIVPNTGAGVWEGLEANDLGGTECYLEDSRIYYKKLDASNVKQVLVKMIASIDNLDEDEQIPIPADMEALLIEQVVAAFSPSKATVQDKHNDSNTQQITQ